MNKSDNFYRSWQYLNNLECVYYKGVSQFRKCLDIEVVKINPDTDEIDNDNSKNTKTEVWLEFGGITYDENLNGLVPIHDINLDCGYDTFEQAIITLAQLCKINGYKERNNK